MENAAAATRDSPQPYLFEVARRSLGYESRVKG